MNQQLTDQEFISVSAMICFKTDETDKQLNPREGATNNAQPNSTACYCSKCARHMAQYFTHNDLNFTLALRIYTRLLKHEIYYASQMFVLLSKIHAFRPIRKPPPKGECRSRYHTCFHATKSSSESHQQPWNRHIRRRTKRAPRFRLRITSC